jgi:hypothetical protein
MQDNDSIIKPVENMQNIGAMKPVDRRAERRRQRQQKQHSEETDQQIIEKALEDEITAPGSSRQDSIDYRA